MMTISSKVGEESLLRRLCSSGVKGGGVSCGVV